MEKYDGDVDKSRQLLRWRKKRPFHHDKAKQRQPAFEPEEIIDSISDLFSSASDIVAVIETNREDNTKSITSTSSGTQNTIAKDSSNNTMATNSSNHTITRIDGNHTMKTNSDNYTIPTNNSSSMVNISSDNIFDNIPSLSGVDGNKSNHTISTGNHSFGSSNTSYDTYNSLESQINSSLDSHNDGKSNNNNIFYVSIGNRTGNSNIGGSDILTLKGSSANPYNVSGDIHATNATVNGLNLMLVIFFFIASVWLILASFHFFIAVLIVRLRSRGVLDIYDENFGRIYIFGNCHIRIGWILRRYVITLGLHGNSAHRSGDRSGSSSRNARKFYYITRKERRQAIERLLLGDGSNDTIEKDIEQQPKVQSLPPSLMSASSPKQQKKMKINVQENEIAVSTPEDESKEIFCKPCVTPVIADSSPVVVEEREQEDTADIESEMPIQTDDESSVGDQPVCVICLETYVDCAISNENRNTDIYNSIFISKHCGHCFHTNCILEWLERRANIECPCCRYPIVSDKQVWDTVKQIRKENRKLKKLQNRDKRQKLLSRYCSPYIQFLGGKTQQWHPKTDNDLCPNDAPSNENHLEQQQQQSNEHDDSDNIVIIVDDEIAERETRLQDEEDEGTEELAVQQIDTFSLSSVSTNTEIQNSNINQLNIDVQSQQQNIKQRFEQQNDQENASTSQDSALETPVQSCSNAQAESNISITESAIDQNLSPFEKEAHETKGDISSNL